MKYTELQDKSLEELNKLLKEKKLEVFTLKVKLKTMQLTNTAELREAKKDVARIKTAISAKMKNR
ncbi:MAG: 50S ribosomal protein L29 [Epsilonproteobacteria bacterium]|nr:50S ribosomal protein L29 [Campylobacterota bacterium]